MHIGAKKIIAMGIFTIFSAVMSHQVFHISASWGMMFGLSILKLYSYRLKVRHKSTFDIYKTMSKIEKQYIAVFLWYFSSGWRTLFYWLVNR